MSGRAVLRCYESIYAALYGFSVDQWHGDEYMASFFTACTLAGAVVMNLVLAMGALVLAGWGGALRSYLPAWAVTPVIIGILSANYFIFIRNDRYKTIVERFLSETATERQRVLRLAWVYLLASYLAPIGLFLTAS